jgi:hypothetical protein
MRSSGTDLLQLCDLLLGAVVYEYKVARKLGRYKPKVDLLKYVKKRAGVPTFIGGYSDARMNIAEYAGEKAKRRPWTLRPTPVSTATVHRS